MFNTQTPIILLGINSLCLLHPGVCDTYIQCKLKPATYPQSFDNGFSTTSVKQFESTFFLGLKAFIEEQFVSNACQFVDCFGQLRKHPEHSVDLV